MGGDLSCRAGFGLLTTVNVEIFAQYIFSRMALCVRKYDVSENLNHYVRKNLSARKCQIGLDARKFSSTKISTFTVFPG